MGSAIGKRLIDSGFDVYTTFEGRSERTISQAQKAGLKDAGSFESLITQTSTLLSIIPPDHAGSIAMKIAAAAEKMNPNLNFIECNAISPRTMNKISLLFKENSTAVIDVGIIGGPPTPNSSPRIYCSGPNLNSLSVLSNAGLDVRILSHEIGDASAFKMLYAASTKGTTALWTQFLVAAKKLNLDEQLLLEFQGSRLEVSESLIKEIPRMPRRAKRWIGEMNEIAQTFADLGMTPNLMTGAAEIFEFVSETSLSEQTSDEENPSLDFALKTLVENLHKKNN